MLKKKKFLIVRYASGREEHLKLDSPEEARVLRDKLREQASVISAEVSEK